MGLLDMAVMDELEHPSMLKQVDTDAKIQILLQKWQESREEASRMEGQFDSVGWGPPWDADSVPWEVEKENKAGRLEK